MRPVYFVTARRTPIGRVGGALSGVRPDDLAATVIRSVLADNPWLDPARIDDIYWGAANQSGEDNRDVARMAGLLAGLPVSVPGATVNRLCASGLEAVICAARAIGCGEADICLAGGSESMSRAPFVIPRPEQGFPRQMELVDSRLGWRMVNPAMRELHQVLSLGATAEEVADRYRINRTRQDEFALRSHLLAADAQAGGRFADQMVPVVTGHGTVEADEGVRPDASLERLAALRPAFRPDGSVTAGNSSPLNDGAAGLLLVSEEVAAQVGRTPLGRYVAAASVGVHPDVMGIGPVPATRKVLGRLGWGIGDIDLVELNEAFAAQTVAVLHELKLDPAVVNVNGGAIALGHPLGCSGARILTTLLHQMAADGARRGLATMCVGVGQGVALIVERS